MTRIFHAHSTPNPDERDWQTLSDHLNVVGRLAGQSAKHFGSSMLAETAGKLRDPGKYTDAYQQPIRGGSRVDPATWGAKIACDQYGSLGRIMAYGIAGHHVGLANDREPGKRTSPDSRLTADLPRLLDDYLNDLVLPATAKEIEPISLKSNAGCKKFQLSMLTRMIFSCVVDGDYLDTDRFLAFALDHAIAHGLGRVIFVIPFTSVAEQNAAVFKKAFGDLGDAPVLEHHNTFVPTPSINAEAAAKPRVVMHSRDAPMIVTTSMQFFESLYTSKLSQRRKLHNITGSGLIFDEARALPLSLLRPCVAVVDELTFNYRTSVVLCNATQSALIAPVSPGGFEDVIELAPDPEAQCETPARVTVSSAGTLDDDALAQHMRDHEQVLRIVNNRPHAQALYTSIADEQGARHLSTLMYPKHRTRVLNEVRSMLNDKEPCRLVSTSLIEAGVDIDLPYVMHAEAGIDSVAQAAVRCNRSGKRTRTDSIVEIFTTVDTDWALPQALEAPAAEARAVMSANDADPLSIAAMNAYFKAVHGRKGPEEFDKQNLLRMIKLDGLAAFKFDLVYKKFRMIDSIQMPLIIPGHDACQALLHDLEHTENCGGIARKLQPFLIQIPHKSYDALAASSVIQPAAEPKYGPQFIQLIAIYLYSDRYGLQLGESALLDAAGLIY